MPLFPDEIVRDGTSESSCVCKVLVWPDSDVVHIGFYWRWIRFFNSAYSRNYPMILDTGVTSVGASPQNLSSSPFLLTRRSYKDLKPLGNSLSHSSTNFESEWLVPKNTIDHWREAMTRIRILGICGSLRQSSANKDALEYMQSQGSELGVEFWTADPSNVPLFNPRLCCGQTQARHKIAQPDPRRRCLCLRLSRVQLFLRTRLEECTRLGIPNSRLSMAR